MSFATRADLLRRSNARRLAQLVVPTDVATMPPVDALRVAIEGGDLSSYSDDARRVMGLMLETIDNALGDADAVILSYGIPATVTNTLLSRIASTIAFYFLQGDDKITEEVKRSYDAVIKLLDQHKKGVLDLINAPVEPVPPETDDHAVITSSPSRYGSRCSHTIDWVG